MLRSFGRVAAVEFAEERSTRHHISSTAGLVSYCSGCASLARFSLIDIIVSMIWKRKYVVGVWDHKHNAGNIITTQADAECVVMGSSVRMFA